MHAQGVLKHQFVLTGPLSTVGGFFIAQSSSGLIGAYNFCGQHLIKMYILILLLVYAAFYDVSVTGKCFSTIFRTKIFFLFHLFLGQVFPPPATHSLLLVVVCIIPKFH